MPDKVKLRICFVLIVIAFWCTHIAFETSLFKGSLAGTRHLFNFLLLILVSLTGSYGCSLLPQKWIELLWKIIYGLIILLIGILGLIDVVINFSSLNFRYLVSGLRLFFTSPVPFGVFVFLSKIHSKRTKPAIQH